MDLERSRYGRTISKGIAGRTPSSTRVTRPGALALAGAMRTATMCTIRLPFVPGFDPSGCTAPSQSPPGRTAAQRRFHPGGRIAEFKHQPAEVGVGRKFNLRAQRRRAARGNPQQARSCNSQPALATQPAAPPSASAPRRHQVVVEERLGHVVRRAAMRTTRAPAPSRVLQSHSGRLLRRRRCRTASVNRASSCRRLVSRRSAHNPPCAIQRQRDLPAESVPADGVHLHRHAEPRPALTLAGVTNSSKSGRGARCGCDTRIPGRPAVGCRRSPNSTCHCRQSHRQVRVGLVCEQPCRASSWSSLND